MADEQSRSLVEWLSAACAPRAGAWLHGEVPILWAIDPTGALWVAFEEVVARTDQVPLFPKPYQLRLSDEFGKLGHPALVGGGPARVAGELYMDDDEFGEPAWTINLRSGRYSSNRSDLPDGVLDRVAELFRSCGIHVMVAAS